MKAVFFVGTAVATLLIASALTGTWASAQTTSAPSSPQRNLSYAAIHDPQFIPASQASFMHPDDRLIGLVAGRVAKAYPAAILSQHGLVEDSSPVGPIAITW